MKHGQLASPCFYTLCTCKRCENHDYGSPNEMKIHAIYSIKETAILTILISICNTEKLGLL